jgi:S1-C subfamily serine protease
MHATIKIRLPKYATPRRHLLTGVALFAGTALALNAPGQGNPPAGRPSLALRVDEAPLVRNATNTYAPVVQKVTPSVVRIAVTIEGPRDERSQAERDFFRRFFGPQGPLGRSSPEAEREHALGSGVIVSADGYVVTNNHVVQNARDIEVSLNDGRTLAAKVIGTDPQTDVALIKIDAQNLPFLMLTDSDKVQVGDVVLRVLGTSARKPPLSDTFLWATLSLAHPFKIEVILSKRVDVLPKQRGREAQNIVSITWPSARSWPTIGPMCSVFQATTVT